MQYGFSLLEVLLALVLLSLTVLTVSSVLQNVQANNLNSYWSTVATIQLANLHDSCLTKSLDIDFPAWNSLNSKLLPHGVGKYEQRNGGYDFTVCWMNKLRKRECLIMKNEV